MLLNQPPSQPSPKGEGVKPFPLGGNQKGGKELIITKKRRLKKFNLQI